jgi:hypothetical protein
MLVFIQQISKIYIRFQIAVLQHLNLDFYQQINRMLSSTYNLLVFLFKQLFLLRVVLTAGACLTNLPIKTLSSYFNASTYLPGQLFTVDDQCKMLYGNNSAYSPCAVNILMNELLLFFLIKSLFLFLRFQMIQFAKPSTVMIQVLPIVMEQMVRYKLKYYCLK